MPVFERITPKIVLYPFKTVFLYERFYSKNHIFSDFFLAYVQGLRPVYSVLVVYKPLGTFFIYFSLYGTESAYPHGRL